MFTAKVYNVMLGSLSGAMEEVFAAKEVIRKWNQQNAEREGKVFLSCEWSTKPQDLQKVDVVIGIVGNWIGDTRFIETCIESGKQVILLFNAFQDPKNTINSEHYQVKVFRDMIESHCNCAEYNGISNLTQLLNERLRDISKSY